LLGNRKKIAKFLMMTFTCRSTFLYGYRTEGLAGRSDYTLFCDVCTVLPSIVCSWAVLNTGCDNLQTVMVIRTGCLSRFLCSCNVGSVLGGFIGSLKYSIIAQKELCTEVCLSLQRVSNFLNY
jgi:hypothetical protein